MQNTNLQVHVVEIMIPGRHRLGKPTVDDGVAEEEARRVLNINGVDHAQWGYVGTLVAHTQGSMALGRIEFAADSRSERKKQEDEERNIRETLAEYAER